MIFPEHDSFWLEAARFIEIHYSRDYRIFGPREFLQKFAQLYGYGCSHAFECGEFDVLIVHKGMLDCLRASYLESILRRDFLPAFANEVFVVLSREPSSSPADPVHYHALIEAVLVELRSRKRAAESIRDRAALVTTYNRPWALARSLPQVTALDVPVLVVDDGSDEEPATENQRLAADNGAMYLRLPRNRGVACAIGTGIEYWLADPGVAWISYHQDDTDVHPRCLTILDAVKDPGERPILTGRFPTEYAALGRIEVAGREVLLLRDCPGHHFYAHRDYWSGVLPIPTAYLGAPKAPGGLGGMGPEEDHWITAWSPQSVTKRKEAFVACVPNLVRSFTTTPDQSTWGRGRDQSDAPLARDPND